MVILCSTEGLNPVEVRQIERYLDDSDTSQDPQEDQLHKTLQGKPFPLTIPSPCDHTPSSGLVVSRLVGRASKTLVGLGRQLVAMGDRVTKQQLQQALRNYHISLTVEVPMYTHPLPTHKHARNHTHTPCRI